MIPPELIEGVSILLQGSGFDVFPIKDNAGLTVSLAASHADDVLIIDFITDPTSFENDLLAVRYRLATLLSQPRVRDLRPNLDNTIIVSFPVDSKQQLRLDQERYDLSLCKRRVVVLDAYNESNIIEELRKKMNLILSTDTSYQLAEIESPLDRLAARAATAERKELIEAFKRAGPSGLKRTIEEWSVASQ